MNLQEMCEPAKNPQLAGMLKKHGFPVNIDHQKVMRTSPDGEAGIAFGLSNGEIFTNGGSLLLVLFPSMGTGVVAHPEVVEERVTYLGPIFGDEKTEIACKLQVGNLLNRDISQDSITRYIPGQEFTPISLEGNGGYYHGFHNLNPGKPVALHIARIFYRDRLTESL